MKHPIKQKEDFIKFIKIIGFVEESDDIYKYKGTYIIVYAYYIELYNVRKQLDNQYIGNFTYYEFIKYSENIYKKEIRSYKLKQIFEK